MIKKKIILYFLLIICLNFKVLSEENVYIVYKVDGEIITNIDITNEKKYLLALNSQLQSLNDDQLSNISEQSIIREAIKKKEVIKYFKLDQSDQFINDFIYDLYLRLELNNKEELEQYLNKSDLNIFDVRKKIEIEMFWNRLIYQKYKNQININEASLKKKINDEEIQDNKKVFLLTEIIFQKKSDISNDDQLKRLTKSIDEVGFKNTASIYRLSNSAKLGGDIGWIDETSLSREIIKKLNNIGIGDFIGPITVGSNLLLLKIENIKFEKKENNKKIKLEKMIQFETNKQLGQFSKIYFNRIKINTNINEL